MWDHGLKGLLGRKSWKFLNTIEGPYIFWYGALSQIIVSNQAAISNLNFVEKSIKNLLAM